MRPYIRSMQSFLRQIREDSMLFIICAVPLLVALVFRFGVPMLENLLCEVFGEASVLSDYYLLFDLFLAVITPYMFVFVSAMVMLTEMDDHIAIYLAVTPIRKKGYIISRLGFPAAISMVVTAVLMSTCALSQWSIINIMLVSMSASLISIPIAMLIVAFSHNRVEGMALAKMAGLVLLGLPAPFFLPMRYQYFLGWLPSFWTAKAFVDMKVWPLIPLVAVSLLWIWALYRRFQRKII